MNNTWNVAKFGWMIIALPLVATAAASAHFQIVQSTPIAISTVAVKATQDIGTHRTHTVARNGSGGVTGRVHTMDMGSGVRGVGGLKVRFVQNGTTVSQTTTQSSGLFTADNVPTGVYSFVASGSNGFSAYGIRVVPSDSVKYDNFMEATAIPHFDEVKRILETAPETKSLATYKAAMDEKGSHQVTLKNGTLNGKMFTARDEPGEAAKTEVFILQNGVAIANVMVNDKGEYQVPNMKPGTYGLVAIGPKGVAAIAFEAVDSDDQTNNAESGNVVFVSTAAKVLPLDDVLNVYLTPSQDTFEPTPTPTPDPIVQDAFQPIEFAGQDAAFGASSGANAGAAGDFSSFAATPTSGGGGAGGFAGGGRLVTLGLIGGIIALGVTNGNTGVASNPDP